MQEIARMHSFVYNSNKGTIVSYQIVTDSSATLPLELIKEFGLTILPLSYMDTATGVQTPIDVFDENFDLVAFYNNMRNGTVYSTSLPNPSDTRDTLTKLVEDGNDLLYIGFDSAISGTYESVSSIMNQLAEEHPERKLVPIDTLTAAGGQGLLVYYACRMKQKGAGLEEVEQWVRNNQLCVDHWFTVEDLQYLLRGGRVSKTSATVGTLLNVKPVLTVNPQGVLTPIEKVLGRKKSMQALIKHFGENHSEIDDDYVVCIAHADSPKDAEWLKNELAEKYGVKHFFVELLDPVVGAHTGPGLLVICYPCKPRA